jgi:type I restriction-modification system DNA methylase subunit
MSPKAMNVLHTVRNELTRLGYLKNLLQDDYVFDDASASQTRDLEIPLAAFAQWPPSYRNACIGVLTANGQSGPPHVSGYQSLGAPMFFEAFHDRIDRYRIESTGRAVFLETIPARDIHRAFQANSKTWSPDAIFRAKAITPFEGAIQLDFVDIGLLPALKGMIHDKLDRLLKDILHEAIITYKNSTANARPDETLLFRLVFRFLAAKIFGDRKHQGNWSAGDAKTIIDAIQRFYGFTTLETQPILDEPNTQQIVWDRFRAAFNFQNLSVEDLAFIYENTLIRKETRKQYGIHSTPSTIAELIVDRLPFESLPQDKRHVLEPCAGHGVFLVAALRRLRELLPPSWTDQERHEYLKDRLTAIEVDTFAAEVCCLSLMLADYPNPDGWQIKSQDIFGTDVLERQLQNAQIILCNPPFEDFRLQERNRYGDRIQSTHKPYEILRRVLEQPPEMLGFVLPKSAIVGAKYRDIQDHIARTYKHIESIALPDRIFAHSDQETMLVLASERNKSRRSIVSTRTFWVRENHRRAFLQTGLLPEGVGKVVNRSANLGHISLANVPLSDVWDYLKGYPNLKNIAEIHRGIEWNIPLKENRSILISSEPKPGFKKGLDVVPGKIEPYYASEFVYLNMEERYRRTNAHSFPWEKPKVISNRHAISRGPWRIVGFPDSSGLVCRENFIAIWPKAPVLTETISALINCPLVNAALFFREEKRRNRNTTLREIPIPFPEAIENDKIAHLIKRYTELRSEIEKYPDKQTTVHDCIKTLMEIDALILKAYDLPPRLERKLLDFFREYPRPVPFDFPDFYPEDFAPCIPLHKYLEMDLKQASAGELLKRITPFDSEDIHEFVMDLEERQA